MRILALPFKTVLSLYFSFVTVLPQGRMRSLFQQEVDFFREFCGMEILKGEPHCPFIHCLSRMTWKMHEVIAGIDNGPDAWSVQRQGGADMLIFTVPAALPLEHEGVSFRAMEYSPLLGGFAIVLADGRGGFLSASTARFDPQVEYYNPRWHLLESVCIQEII